MQRCSYAGAERRYIGRNHSHILPPRAGAHTCRYRVLRCESG
jgi:hypothetical protein